MTKNQREVMRFMKSSEGAFAVKHKIGNRIFFRILTKDRSPLFNASYRSFSILINKGMLCADKSDTPIVYKLTEDGLKYKMRKRNERATDTV